MPAKRAPLAGAALAGAVADASLKVVGVAGRSGACEGGAACGGGAACCTAGACCGAATGPPGALVSTAAYAASIRFLSLASSGSLADINAAFACACNAAS